MSKKLIFSILLLSLIAESCRKPADEEVIQADEKVMAASDLELSSALATPTARNSMINYESYYVSAADSRIHGYIISLPLTYNEANSTKYPLMVFLHGAGEKPLIRDYEINKLKAHGPHREIYSKKRSFPAIVVSLQMEKWAGEIKPAVVKEFIDILTGAKKVSQARGAGVGLMSYKVDASKISLTGLSQGGNSVYKTAFSYPNTFASISVFAGYVCSPSDMALIKIPTYIRHNSGDLAIGVTNAYNAKSWIDRGKPTEPVDLNIYKKFGHDSWSASYASEELYTWHWSKSRKGVVTIPPVTKPDQNNSEQNNSGGSKPEPVPVPVPVPLPVPVPVPLPVPAPAPSGAPVISALSPKNNSTLTRPSNGLLSLDITFNKNIKRGSGLVEIKNVTGKSSTFFNSSWSMIRISGKMASIYPVSIAKGKKYVIKIASGAFYDQSGKLAFSGIQNETTWTFTTR